jgi:aldose sugar dehydrogenase
MAEARANRPGRFETSARGRREDKESAMAVDNTAENAERCVCPTCPTYTDCMGEGAELLFCARGVSGCSPVAVSCKCAGCAVWSSNGLSSYYFCLKGAAS